jgi:hypothetical protein
VTPSLPGGQAVEVMKPETNAMTGRKIVEIYPYNAIIRIAYVCAHESGGVRDPVASTSSIRRLAAT